MHRFRFPPPSPPEPSSAPVPDLNTFLGWLDARLDELESRLRSIEEERPRKRPRYASPDELAREFGINDQTLRGWLFSRAENGLDAVIVTQGRRLYLDRDAFARWFSRGEGRGRKTRPSEGKRGKGRADDPPREGS